MKKNSFLVMALALLILLGAANTAQAVEVVKSIPINAVSTIAYDSYKEAIWVTTATPYVNEMGMHVSELDNTVTAISDSNYEILTTVAVGKSPSDIAYDSALNEIWVTNQRSGTISIISDNTNTVVATIDVGNVGPFRVVYDSGKGEMFVNDASGVIYVISDRSRQVVATIPLGKNPYPGILIYDSGKGEIFVGYASLPGQNPADFISVISDSTNSVIATIPLGGNTVTSGVYDPRTNKLYMTNLDNGSIIVVSDETNSVVNSIPTGGFPLGIGYDSNKGVLFVRSSENTTSIVSDKTETVIDTVPISCITMVYDPERSVMFVLGNESIQVVSDASLPSVSSNPTPSPTNTMASPTPTVPEFPATLAITLLAITALAVAVVIRKKHSEES